ncbi:MAG: peroxiredoxin-like family protein [Mucilaginibacter sp.]|uniref:peroxiredoxin-like family protein n=1 Tax=Mucilaginibacter sp. TaxID=1882438 RepID=UPI003265556C
MKKIFILSVALLFALATFAQSGLKVGATAPQFTAKDNAGKTLDLKSLLKSHKAVVLFFYRGQWCPYCNKQIKQLQDSLQLLTGKGAYVIGVTPETEDNIAKTVEKTKASFSMVQDKDYAIMKAYGVNYTMDAAMVTKYKTYGIDLDKNNGNTDHVLPVPATYVINKSGKITFVQFDKDYKKRASVAEIMKQSPLTP